jgi:Tfp pilus assembly protein PilO
MARSSQERLWLIGGGVGAFLLMLVGYFLVISPQRQNTQSVNDQTAAAQLQTVSLQQRITALTAQNKDLAKYENKLAELRLALPTTSGLPDFLRTLQSLGNATLADVTSLTVGAPAAVTAGLAPAASPGATPSATATTAAPAPTTTATPGVTAPAADALYALPITAQVAGSTKQLNDFLDQLQSVQPRAVLITAITVGSAVASGSATSTANGTTMSLTMQAFVTPVSAAEAAQLAQAAPK